MAKRKTTDFVQLNVRMREGLRAKLEQSAKRNLESLNREVVDRLERSFDRQDLLIEALSLTYGRRLAGLLMVIGRALQDAGRQGAFAADMRSNRENWMDVPFAYQQAVVAALSVMDKLKPSGELTGPSKSYVDIFKGANAEHIGVITAMSLTEAVKGKASPDLRRWAAPIRELLEPEEDDE